MTSPPILVSIDSNEATRPRADLIRMAIEKDEHFFSPVGENASLPFDLRFIKSELDEDSPVAVFVDDEGNEHSEPSERKYHSLHIELKDFTGDGNSDYLSSIISGHLWEQCLAARELGEPVIIAVLGDDRDVNDAIKTAASRNHRVDAKKLFQYFQMVDGFEANCIGLGIPVWRLKTDPWKRLLLRVRKILEGGDLAGFAPSPADGERQAVGLSILAGNGIGPVKARSILDKFHLILEPCADDCYLTDCDGVGEKLARRIGDSKNFAVDCRKIIRPPKPKKAKLAEQSRQPHIVVFE